MSKDKINIRKFVLENSVKFEGKANPGSVIGKIISEHPEIKKDMKTIAKEISKEVEKVNKTSLEEQIEELKKYSPDHFKKKKKKEERNIFRFFGIKEGEQIRTAFPPGPEKYPHLGHAKAALMNFLLAKQYSGKFTLRFEDTNPELVKKKFYDVIRENLGWLGIGWDELYYASDYMPRFYELAEKLIKDGKAYVDFSSQETMKESRMKKRKTKYRDVPIEQNLKAWKDMPGKEAGSCVLRLKIDIKHQNTTMRDPTIFRIIKKTHPRTKDKYTVWPTYDFQNSVMDSLTMITHRIRTKEFELRAELQRHIQNILGLKETKTYEMARFNLKGVPSSGRLIREKIEKGELLGWDDPTLTTIVALKRRGFTPIGIKQFLLSTGITKSESTLEWDDLVVQNRRVVDKEAKRYFFIKKPKKIRIENSPDMTVKLKNHPEEEKRRRLFHTREEFFIEEEDYRQLKDNKLYRLMDCLNFRKEKERLIFDSREHERYKEKGEKIIHWLPANDSLIDTEIMMPDKHTEKGFSEGNIKKVEKGEIIQFERFGFCRLDSSEKRKEQAIKKFWFTHK